MLKKNNFIGRLKETFEGQPWHGNSLLLQIQNVSAEVAFFRPTPLSHNIAEILKHLTLWREFIYQKLRLNVEYNLRLNSPEEWLVIETGNQESLYLLIEELKNSQAKILLALETFNDNNFLEQVPAKKYSYQFMLEGLIQHDVYHSGQIGLLKSIFEKVKAT